MIYEKWIKEWKSALAENFYLRVICLLLSIGMIVNVVFLRGKDRLIIVPPKIEKEFWIEDSKSSEAYLEQMGVFFATLAGNMSPANAEYNAKLLSSYLDASSFGDIKNEITAQAAYFKKNNISQSFFPKGTKIDINTGRVEIEGDVIRYIGSVKVSQEKILVIVKLNTKGYHLKIDELYVTYPERELQKMKQKEEEKAKTPEERKKDKEVKSR